MADPVIVYLDSQDFSRFSTSHQDYLALRPVRDTLLSMRDAGLARFVFSDVHIFEAMPIRPDICEPGLERIRTISEFCGSWNLSSSSTIVDREVRLLCGVDPAQEWKEWFPYFEIEEPDKKSIFAEVADEVASNRKQRRALAKLIKQPIPTAISEQSANELLEKFPFLNSGKKELRSYFSGHTRWRDVENLLRVSLRDIVGFSQWLVTNWEQGQKFIEILRAGNQKVQTTLVDLYGKMKENYRTNPLSEERTSQVVTAAYRQQRDRLFTEFVRRNYQRILDDVKISDATFFPDPARAPSLATMCSFIWEVAYLSALPRNPRNPSKHAGSDYADAMHTLFLPEVDIFRADQFTCSVLAKMTCQGNARLCSSLLELPRLIADSGSART